MEVDRARMATGRNAMGRRFWRSRAAWLGFFLTAAFTLVACTSSSAATDRSSANRPDNAALDFELALFENENHTRGEVLRLSDLRGSPVALNFWFPSCPPCVQEMPDLEAAFQRYRDDGVEFVGVQLVGVDTAEDGQAFVDRLGVTYALGPDETSEITINDYKVIGFPTTVFIDRDQNIVRKWTGILNAEKIEELIQELLN